MTQPVQGKNALAATADIQVEQASADAFDAVVVPGGWAPDQVWGRAVEDIPAFCRELVAT